MLVCVRLLATNVSICRTHLIFECLAALVVHFAPTAPNPKSNLTALFSFYCRSHARVLMWPSVLPHILPRPQARSALRWSDVSAPIRIKNSERKWPAFHYRHCDTLPGNTESLKRHLFMFSTMSLSLCQTPKGLSPVSDVRNRFIADMSFHSN